MSKKDNSPNISQRKKFESEIRIKERTDLTEKQKDLINLITDKETKVVFIKGPAGTSKTFCAILAGLKLLQNKYVSDIIYIRSIIESASKSLGSLPGTQAEKMEPFLMPLVDKLEELLSKTDIEKLLNDDRIKGIPVNYLRGSSFNAKFIIADESQNYNKKELTTIISRLGEKSKLIILADPLQSDINGLSAFMPFYNLFNDNESKENGIHCFEFTKDDIVRSGILKFIVEKIEKLNTDQKTDWHPGK